nr:protein kinase-like domain-containing protein [Tanacetum cinerariifolium]
MEDLVDRPTTPLPIMLRRSSCEKLICLFDGGRGSGTGIYWCGGKGNVRSEQRRCPWMTTPYSLNCLCVYVAMNINNNSMNKASSFKPERRRCSDLTLPLTPLQQIAVPLPLPLSNHHINFSQLNRIGSESGGMVYKSSVGLWSGLGCGGAVEKNKRGEFDDLGMMEDLVDRPTTPLPIMLRRSSCEKLICLFDGGRGSGTGIYWRGGKGLMYAIVPTKEL